MFSSPPPRLQSRDWLILLLITVLGFAVRLWALARMPPGVWFDEGLNGLNALGILGGDWALYFNRHGLPQEPLHMYFIAMSVKLFGATAFAIRLPSVLIGTATLPVVFGCMREVFRSNRPALLAVAAFAVMRWHVHFSCLGLRTIWVPLICAACVWLALAGLRHPRRTTAVALGAVMALGFYTYLAARLIPLVIFALLVWDAFHRPWRRGLGRGIAIASVVFFVGIAPLTIYLLNNEELLTGRVMDIALVAQSDDEETEAKPEPESTGPPAEIGQGRRFFGGIGENTLANIWVFNVWGDHVLTHGLPRVPLFDPLTGALFLAGLVMTMFHWRVRVGSSVLALWLGIMLLASVLSFGAPNALRTLGAAPAAMTLAVLGLWRVHVFVRSRGGKRLAIGFVAAWLCWFGAVELSRVAQWSVRPDVWEQFNGRESTVANAILEVPEDALVAAFEGWFGNDTFALLTNARTDLQELPTYPPPEMPAILERETTHLFLLTEIEPQRGWIELIRDSAVPHSEEVFTLPSGLPYAMHITVNPREEGDL